MYAQRPRGLGVSNEMENNRSRTAGNSSSRCLRNMDHCCWQICCCRGSVNFVNQYCHCGFLRSYCRRKRLCVGPDMDPDTEALQPCRDRRCPHCFEAYCEDDSNEESLSEEEEEEEEEEDSGFDEMD